MHTGCSGPASTPAWLVTEPCVPMNLSVHYNVSTAQVMWAAARGASSYSVQAVADLGSGVTCNTNNTTCSMNGLQCGQIYNVTVMARNTVCDSMISETSRLMTEPCPPTNVQVSKACEQLTATVSWQQSDFAVGYVAFFDNQGGHFDSCYGTDTSTQCVVSGLMCGTEYNVWVKALGQQYNSSDSAVVSFTEPCQTSSITAIMDCEADSATISWQPSVGVVSCVTELTASSGHTTSCTTNNTNCQLSSLQCGEEYNVTVKALGNTCNQTAHMAGHLTTEPCVPMNLSVHHNVGTAQVMWAAARGATSYSVQAVADLGSGVTCNTTNTTCSINGLQCGQIYNVTVMAQNLACNSTSEPYHHMTEPCPPTNVQVSMACEQLTATVSWQQSDFAVGYVAYFDNQGGHSASCYGTDTSTQCVVSGLMCGTEYNVWVKALGQQYNSSDSTVVSLTSAPCLPREVEIEVDCIHDGAAVVSWNATYGAANFSLTAMVSGSLLSLCETQPNSCNVTGLSCGETYNLNFTASNEQCSLSAPMQANLTTRPCPPQRVDVSLQCGSHTAVLSWEERSDVELYVANAIKTSGGPVQTCNSTGSTCQFASLDCGETYNFTVTADSQGCRSQASSTVSIQTAPCPPSDVTTYAQCEFNMGSVSWGSSDGAETYVAVATGLDGHAHQCLTNSTDCSWNDLHCGEEYTVVVRAKNGNCTSLPSNSSIIYMAPCPPSDVTTYAQCEFNMGSVSWGSSDGAETYVAVATGLDGHAHQCLTNSTDCSWNDLHCGEEYTVVVRAKNGNCTSLPSNSSIIYMAPCPPSDVTTYAQCEFNMGSVSWGSSDGAETYVAVATGLDGHAHQCLTNSTDCSWNDLHCGEEYTVVVRAKNGNCTSLPSNSSIIYMAPCPPQNLSAEVDCLSNDLMIYWDAVREADHFLTSVTADNGVTIGGYNTTNTACSIRNVTCGKTFSVHVTSIRGACRSQQSQAYSIMSAPCQPERISGRLDCVTNSAWISWDAAPGADSYTVSAVGEDNYTGNCTSSSNTTCEVEDLACGSLYNFSVIAKNSKCESQPSATIDLQTAPCTLSGITAVAQCHNSSILVLWDAEGNTVYTATAEASDHTYLSCNNTGTSCYLHGAQCGLHYTIIVAASSDQCSSLRSPPYRISMEPCPPSNVVVGSTCADDSALVSWSPSLVAETYHVVAMGANGHVHTCNTTSSNCSISELHCGQQYDISVTASRENCTSKASQNATLNTGPCQPDGLSVISHCNNQSALLSWTPGDNAVDYYGCAQAENGDMLYCESTNPSCTIQGLDCGTLYNFTVQASDGTCNSSVSEPVQSGAAPCPPDSVDVEFFTMQNEAQMLYFNWSQITCRDTEYLLELNGSLLGDSQALFEISSYWTSMTHFEIPLPCGSSYWATVESRNTGGTSQPSVPLSGTTAPCPPIAVEYSGNNTFATVSWNTSVFATSYTVYDNSVTPRSQLCSTAGLSCSLHSITSTDLVITASNTAGDSEETSVSIAGSSGRRRRDLSGHSLENGGLPAPVLHVKQALPTVIFLEWSPVEAASQYSLLIRKQDSSRESEEITVQGESIILTDLIPNSAYCFSVSAEYTATSGPQSEPVCVQTAQELSQ
ncbi:receptor-type tyrosine-protein phosphatase beta-like isoform X2 [Trematomus bernacchii]|uniref:receptor-type tyrosine-protein phosphatase beta-like isoform X2 n=1 Tax=Trematomus bernacchii TaxID=40690 RepID=UPI00146BD82C|nr:receptor-type tyrosine-protein phosphatase beta-like isoform X2 [Trematomus bernacchii]